MAAVGPTAAPPTAGRAQVMAGAAAGSLWRAGAQGAALLVTWGGASEGEGHIAR